MTYEELFDAYRQVVSQRDQLRQAGDDLWSALDDGLRIYNPEILACWESLRGIGNEPPVEDWAEC